MSFFGFGKKKTKEADNTAREELFKAPEPKAPAKSSTSSTSSSASSTKAPSISSSSTSSRSSAAYQPKPLQSTSQQYGSEKEQYDSIVAERRGLDQSSVESTRRSVNRIAEAEMLAAGNLNKLSSQGEQLARTERRLDDAAGHAKVSEARTNDLTRLQAAFFIPVHTTTDKAGFSVNMSGPGKKEQAHIESDSRRKGTMSTMTDHYQGADNSASKLKGDIGGRKNVYEMDDKAVNSEIDQNLNSISGSVARLKAMSLVMNDEIESQNQRLDRMGVKADTVKTSVDGSKTKLEKIIGKPVTK